MKYLYSHDATATVDGTPLELLSWDVAEDPDRFPYVEAILIIPAGSEADMELLDPRNDPRVILTLEVEHLLPTPSTQTRTLDLLIHARGIPTDGTVTLTAVSDEAFLVDGSYLFTSQDTFLRAQEITLRELIDSVIALRVPGAPALESGPDDADVTGTREKVNLCLDPGGENANVAFAIAAHPGAAPTGMVRSSAVTPYFGTYSSRFTAPAGTCGVRVPADSAGAFHPATPGKRYVWAFALRSSVATAAYPKLRFYAGDGTGRSLDFDGYGVNTSTSAWTIYVTEGTAPEWATTVSPIALTTGNPAGRLHYIDAKVFRVLADDEVIREWPTVPVMIPLLDDFPAPFDGSNNPDPARYTASWDGTANESTSRLTPIVERGPASLDTVPGRPWWDYLNTLVRNADLRLWHDGAGKWWLTEPFPAVAGTVTIEEDDNLIDGEDVTSWQATDSAGRPVYYTGVVIRYRWVDQVGFQQERFDVAGTGRKVLTVDVDGAWPGDGRAAALLAFAAGRGRTQEMRAVMNLDARPGMALATDFPGVPAQIGRVGRVRFRGSKTGNDHGVMTVTSRELADA